MQGCDQGIFCPVIRGGTCSEIPLLLSETPDSLCPVINTCPIKRLTICTRSEAEKCGLPLKVVRMDSADIYTALTSDTYTAIRKVSERVMFLFLRLHVRLDSTELQLPNDRLVQLIQIRQEMQANKFILHL